MGGWSSLPTMKLGEKGKGRKGKKVRREPDKFFGMSHFKVVDLLNRF